MGRYNKLPVLSVVFALGLFLLTGTAPANPATPDEIDGSVDAALQVMYSEHPYARVLSREAKGVLVFPEIVEWGLILGGLYGEGALRKGSETASYYSTVAGSIGLKAGIQKYGYALIFMSDSDLSYFEESGGWEIGIGPSVVIVDAGMAEALSTTTARTNVYAFFFGQKGLMAGIGLQGSKITRLQK